MPKGGPPGVMPGMGQNQAPPVPTLNRPVQASPIPGQQPMPMGIGEPNQQATLQQQQRQPQPQQQQQQQQPQQQQPSQTLLQQPRAQARPANGVPLPDDLNTLSPQDYEHVCRLANQMLAKTSPEDMDKIKMNLQNMTPEQRQYLARINIEPMIYFFRSQALNQLRRHKRNRMDLARAQNVGVDPNGAMMGDPMMSAQQRQMFQNMMSLQRNSAFPMNGQQNMDPSSFLGNVENIQGQQADGLRSQEAGQLVVPASSSGMNQQPFTTPQGVFQVGQPLSQNGQASMNVGGISPQFLTQQHLPNDRAQQAAQMQAHSQAQSQVQARMEAAQKAQMAMSSQAGQANSQIPPQLPPQSPAMPMLNRPMPPAQISPPQSHMRPPSRPPGIPQHPAGVQPFAAQPTLPGRPTIPPGLPPAVQEHLAHMSPDQLKAFLMTHHQRMMAANQARANATQQGMHQNVSPPGQGQQTMNSQIANNQNLRAAMGLQQQLSGIGGPQAQNQLLPGQQPSLQQRQQQQQQPPHQQQQQQQDQQRQNELYKLQLLRQQNGGMEMTPEQVREMDRLHFPPSILNTNPNMNSPVPKNIKTWGQLKQWATANPQVLKGVDPPKLMTLQKLHLAQILAQGKDGGPLNGQGNGMSMFPFQGPPQPFMNPQNFLPAQQPAPMNMPPMRPITAQEIQMVRQRYGPQVQQYNDDQLREILIRNRQKQIMQAQARAQAFAQQNMMNQGQQAPQAQPPQPTAVPQSTPQMKPSAAAQQQTSRPGPRTQTTPAQVPAPAKGNKPSTAKQGSKKRTRTDDQAEVQNPTTQTTTQAPLPAAIPAAAAPPRPNNMPFTREQQMAAMTPQQRAQLEAHMRRQQRGPISRAMAEEAWGHLPEKIRQLYGEIQKNAPAADPVAVSPEQKAAMTQQLRECTDMLGRMDTLVQWFARLPGQEKTVRSLLAMVRFETRPLTILLSYESFLCLTSM